MVKVKPTDFEYYMDGYLKSNLDVLKKGVRDDDDALIVVDGLERSGKSVFAFQCALYVDPTFNLDRIVFSPEEFKEAVKKADKYQAIVYDEAITGMRAARWSSEVTQALIEMVAQMGQKNLFVFVVIPSVFELHKYFAIHRSVCLLHVYRDNGQRGFFKFFNRDKKRYLYMAGKQMMNPEAGYPDFIGRFTKPYVVDEQAYRQKKLTELEKPQKKVSALESRMILHRNVLVDYLKTDHKMDSKQIAKVFEAYLGEKAPKYNTVREMTLLNGNGARLKGLLEK